MMEEGARCWVILAVYIISFLVGLPANVLAIHAFSVKIHSKSSPTCILLLNLSLSDLLLLIVLPFKMHEAVSGMVWNLPIFLCSITSFTFFFSIYTSSLLLMAVSVVRFIGVAFPITYHRMKKSVYATVASVVIWLVSAAHCSIVIIVQETHELSNTNSTVCYDNFTEKQLSVLLPVRLEISVVLCFIPLLVCVFCYLGCIWILYNRPNISRMQKKKAIGMALGTLAVFLVCVVPYNLSHLLGYLNNISPNWRLYTLLFSALNTCLDPIIFYFSSYISA
ncbi:free fatty acid receptor 2 [Lampris incognitus]|uniref:free fatty acid receptor 2 n=1 Tax=Lampris incognitus TaxID=2546036 RepID=UPI0024B5D1C4|nr:free fatty acid receptor 2 [Lampris incognitus]